MLAQTTADNEPMLRLLKGLVGMQPLIALSDVIKECIAVKQTSNRRQIYTDELKRLLSKFAEGMEQTPIHLLSAAQIEQWINKHHWGPSTRITVMTRLSTLFGFAEKRGYIQFNPIRRLDRPSFERSPPKILSPAEARKLILLTRKHTPDMLGYIIIGMFTGIRAAELQKLTWSCVNADHIRVDAAASKLRRRRIVPMHPKAIAWLKKIPRGVGDVSPKELKKWRRLQRLAKLMGWEEWPHNILRHTAASYLLALHCDAAKVAMMLGNSPGVLLQHYYELVGRKECTRFWKYSLLRH